MKQRLLTVLALFALTISNAQIIKISDNNGKTITKCKGQFVGSLFNSNETDYTAVGFKGYKDNEKYTVTFATTKGKQVRANFFYYGINAGDTLSVYDGPNTSSIRIGFITNRKLVHPIDALNAPAIFTSTDSSLTFKFTSNNDGSVGYGWDAFIGNTPTAIAGNAPASDDCITATPICNLGGYSGTTSGWFTRGPEAKKIDGDATSATPFCGTTHNNSWLSFNAATSSASFDITSSNCSDPKNGIQAVIMETSDYQTFIRRSVKCEGNAIGQFTLDANNLIPGNKYYIMVDGAFGNDCDYTIKAKSGVATLDIMANTANAFCTDDTLKLTATATGIGPFTYDWAPTPTSGQGKANATFAAATGVTYSCTVTGVCGLPTTRTYAPSVVTTPVITAIDSAIICQKGNGKTIAAGISASSSTIDFKNVNAETIPDNNTIGLTSDIMVGTLTGTIGNQLSKVGININHGDVSELEISLKSPDGNVMILSSGNGLVGANYTNTYFTTTSTTSISTGSEPFSGNFAPIDPFSKITTGAINGKWSLIVKDKKAFNTGLLMDWSLSFKNDFTYSWSPATGLSTTTGNTVIANPSYTTTYTVTITDKAGCPGTKRVKINVTNLPTAPLVNSPVIYCLNASAIALTATTGANTDLVWYTIATGGTSLPTAPIPSTTIAGTTSYFVCGKIGLCEGERSEVKVVVNSKIDPSFTYSSQNFCQNATNQSPILATGALAGTFNATPAGLVFVNDKTGEINLKASKPGTYSITNVIAPIGGCALTTSIPFTVIINAEPIVSNASTASVCSEVPLNIVLTSNVASTYEWQAVDNPNTTGESSATKTATSIINDVIKNNTKQAEIVTYNVKVSATASKCINITPQAIAITVNPNPVVDTTSLLVDASSCGTKSGSITGIAIASGVAPLKYEWKDNLGNIAATTLDLKDVVPGPYILTVTDANGCKTKVGAGKNLNILWLNKVHASFTANPIPVELLLPIDYVNNTTGAVNYNWNFGDSKTSRDMSPTHNYEQLGDFNTCLIADDGAKCFDTVCASIKVFVNSGFIIPNVFTPNNDGTNDFFTIVGKGIASLHAEIFNRWGQKEYQWDAPNGGWDGRKNGKLSPEGTYFVIITAKGMDGKDLIEKGSFTLLR
ncbi:MAG: gliding motility-associated C-terminal domain-containing protein [Bacteroidia bacterium]